MRYTHTRLLIDRFRECFAYYRDVLSLPVVYGDEKGPYAEFKTSSITLALYARTAMNESVGFEPPQAADTRQPRVCLTFEVADVDATFEALKAKGANVVAGPQDRVVWMVRTAHIADPDGNLIEINSALRSQFRQ
jgi:catechol 2,3-dioxygenase-like lactoylglutathione lyase family enzyme